ASRPCSLSPPGRGLGRERRRGTGTPLLTLKPLQATQTLHEHGTTTTAGPSRASAARLRRTAGRDEPRAALDLADGRPRAGADGPAAALGQPCAHAEAGLADA